MDEKKGAGIGLNAFVKLDLLYRLCGERIANRKLRTGLKNPLICMTNIGVLDAARLSFGDSRPTDAYLCGSIKYKPYFQLAMSSYQDELTLSVNLYGARGTARSSSPSSKTSMRNCRVKRNPPHAPGRA